MYREQTSVVGHLDTSFGPTYTYYFAVSATTFWSRFNHQGPISAVDLFLYLYRVDPSPAPTKGSSCIPGGCASVTLPRFTATKAGTEVGTKSRFASDTRDSTSLCTGWSLRSAAPGVLQSVNTTVLVLGSGPVRRPSASQDTVHTAAVGGCPSNTTRSTSLTRTAWWERPGRRAESSGHTREDLASTEESVPVPSEGGACETVEQKVDGVVGVHQRVDHNPYQRVYCNLKHSISPT